MPAGPLSVAPAVFAVKVVFTKLSPVIVGVTVTAPGTFGVSVSIVMMPPAKFVPFRFPEQSRLRMSLRYCCPATSPDVASVYGVERLGKDVRQLFQFEVHDCGEPFV